MQAFVQYYVGLHGSIVSHIEVLEARVLDLQEAEDMEELLERSRARGSDLREVEAVTTDPSVSAGRYLYPDSSINLGHMRGHIALLKASLAFCKGQIARAQESFRGLNNMAVENDDL